MTLGALFSAVLVGILLTAVAPKDLLCSLDDNFLIPVKTLYMNALQMIAAPVAFFSLVGCFSKQTNPMGLGRIGAKIMALYMGTTIIATALGMFTYSLFRPGDPAVAEGISRDVNSIPHQLDVKDISIKEMITGIVPTNFLSPFLDNNMLQLIFLAVLTGLALGLIGEYSGKMTAWFEGCGELFLKIATLVMHITPLAVFCSILSMVLKTGAASLLSVLSMFGTFLFGLALMIAVYSVILISFGLNPLTFFRHYSPYMVQVFSIASSNASISLNIEACKKELGIAPDIYSLSIPLGATINMDGTCVLLAVEVLTLAKIYGVDVPPSAMLGLAISIILMSIGAPGVPGSGVLILSMLLFQIGVAVEGVAFVMGIGPLIGMFISMCNCLGDVVVTTVVAKSEKMINMEAFQKK